MNSSLTRWGQTDTKLLAIILVVACLMFLPALGSAGIVNTSDAYYTEAAREMLGRGDFVTPYLNYSPYYFKPILIYWLIIGSYMVLGVSTFAARLPSALSAIATVVAVYCFSRPFISRRASFFAALALLSMPLFVVVGRVSLTDMPLVLTATIANLLLLKGLIFRKSLKELLLAYVCLGVAMLSKGPLAVAFVGTCVGGFLLVTSTSVKHFFQRVMSLNPVLAVVISLAVALPWYVAEHFASNGAFTRFFFIDQNFGRLSGQFQSHVNPMWFYVPYLAGGFIPWLPLLCSAPFAFRWKKFSRFSQSPRVQLIIGCCCWLFGTLALLLVSSSKVAHYLLPLAPPVAILAGIYLEKIIRLARKRLVLWTAPAMVAACIVGVIAVQKLLRGSTDLRVISTVFLSLLIAGYIAYGVLLYKARVLKAVVCLYACSLLACGVLVPVAIQHTYREGNADFKTLLEQAKQFEGSNIAVVANLAPIAAFYSQRQVFEVNGPYDSNEFVNKMKGPHYFIFDEKTMTLLKPYIAGQHKIVSTSGKWTLLSVEPDGAQSK